MRLKMSNMGDCSTWPHVASGPLDREWIIPKFSKYVRIIIFGTIRVLYVSHAAN